LGIVIDFFKYKKMDAGKRAALEYLNGYMRAGAEISTLFNAARQLSYFRDQIKKATGEGS